MVMLYGSVQTNVYYILYFMYILCISALCILVGRLVNSCCKSSCQFNNNHKNNNDDTGLRVCPVLYNIFSLYYTSLHHEIAYWLAS